METETNHSRNRELLDKEDSTPSWTAAGPRIPAPISKVDWMKEILFRSVRGVEIRSPETRKFYRTLS